MLRLAAEMPNSDVSAPRAFRVLPGAPEGGPSIPFAGRRDTQIAGRITFP